MAFGKPILDLKSTVISLSKIQHFPYVEIGTLFRIDAAANIDEQRRSYRQHGSMV